MLESIEKLRESLKDCTNKAGVEPNRFDTYWITAKACDILIDEVEAEIAERYMPLPVDADGVPIFIGDLLKSDETDEQFICRGYSVTLQPSDNCKWWTVECSYDSYSGTSEYVSAKSCHHVKPRTVEDVLREMVGMTDQPLCEEDIQAFADELREMLGSDAE